MSVAAYELGRRARLDGQPRDQNPYQVAAGLPIGAATGLRARCEEFWYQGWDYADFWQESK
jgi:hypothetical protein